MRSPLSTSLDGSRHDKKVSTLKFEQTLYAAPLCQIYRGVGAPPLTLHTFDKKNIQVQIFQTWKHKLLLCVMRHT